MKTTDVIILGANGTCVEIAEAIDLMVQRDGPLWQVAGFLDDDETLQGTTVGGLPVLGKLADAAKFDNAKFVCGIGGPQSYRHRPEIIAATGLPPDRWLTVVHPRATLSRTVRVGYGTVVLADLQTLFARVSSSLRLFFCFVKTELAAGALVFLIKERVAYVFYLCHDNAFDEQRPALALAVHIGKQYASGGVRYLDYGPTSFDNYSLNEGLAFFKEGIGARGFCRDLWRWDKL